MSDDDLVKRLRVQAASRSGTADVMSDGSIVWHPLMIEAADAIERLTQEREQWKSEIEQVADVWEIMWRGQHKEARADWLIDDILAYVKDKDAELDAAERKVERLREALEPFAGLDLRGAGVDKDEWTIWIKDLRAARAALAETEDRHE